MLERFKRLQGFSEENFRLICGGSRIGRLLIIVLFLSTLILGESGSATALVGRDNRWRAIAREARTAFHERRYADAVAAYARARASLPETRWFDDVRLDMKLDEAEVYRFWGAMDNIPTHLAACEKLLREVERDMLKGAKLDPTFVARFWRRKSDLLLSQNKEQAAAIAYENVLDTLGSLFSTESEHFIGDAEGMVALLCKRKIYTTMLSFFANFEERIPQTDSADQLLEKMYRKYYEKVKVEVLAAISRGQFEYARDLIRRLQRVDRKKDGLDKLWLSWARAVIQSARVDLLDGAKEPLDELSNFYKLNRTTEEHSDCMEALDSIRSASKP